MPHLEWWILIHKGRWNMLGLEHDVCIGFETSLRDICLQTDERPWAHMPCTNMQLSQRCSVAALFFCSLCLCLLIYLIFCFHIPGMSGLFGKVPATLSLESQIPSLSNKPHDTEISTGKSGGVFLIIVDAAVLIFGE